MKITHKKDILPAIFTFHAEDMAPRRNLKPKKTKIFVARKQGLDQPVGWISVNVT